MFSQILWRPFARGHPRQRQIRGQHQGFKPHHRQATPVNSREHQFDHRHRHNRRQPHHRAPGRGEPQSDRGNEFDRIKFSRVFAVTFESP